MNRSLAFVVTALILIAGCGPEKTETTTSGHLHAYFTESFAPPMIQEVNQFLSMYASGGANIQYELVSSDEAIARLLQDTARCIVTARPLTAAERERVPSVDGASLNETIIAYDGLAVVVHDKNRVDEMTTTELTKILSGEISRWEQLSHAKGMRGGIELLYQDSSDISMFVNQRLLLGMPLRKNPVRMRSDIETLHGVADTPLSIGLVGVSWIDSVRVPVKSLKLAETRPSADTTFRVPPEAMGKFFSTHPANVYRSYYPLKRAIYLYTFGPIGSFASGFGSYVANKDGQRLLLNRNIVPGTQPIRLREPQ